MKHSLAWIEKFITPEQQNELMQLSPEKQLETLCDLIESGQLEAAQYLDWASNFFLLPFLESEFFKQVDISETWKKYNSSANWGPEIVPIQEWDNRLMIACHIPPSEFLAKFDLTPQFVIASPVDLKNVWQQLQLQVTEEVVAPPVEQMPVPSETKELAMSFDFKIDESFKPIDFGADDFQIDDGSTPAAEAPQEESSGPAGLNQAPEGIVLNFEIPSEPVEKVIASDSGERVFEMPEPDRNIRFQNPDLVLKSPPPQQKPKSPPPQPQAMQQKPVVATAPPPPPPPPRQQAKVQAAVVVEMPQDNESSMSGKKNLKRTFNNIKSNFEECKSFEEIADLIFFKIRDHYDMSMLMLCQETSLMPWYWSGSFKPSSDQNSQTIQLLQPSIFKVVFDSKKPYHGHVITNGINSKFFNEWNSGDIPKHVTIVSIFIEKAVAGMWFAATNKNIDLEVSLSELDALAAQSAESFLRALQEAA